MISNPSNEQQNRILSQVGNTPGITGPIHDKTNNSISNTTNSLSTTTTVTSKILSSLESPLKLSPAIFQRSQPVADPNTPPPPVNTTNTPASPSFLHQFSHGTLNSNHHQDFATSENPSMSATPLELLLSHICALEIQNLKIKRILNVLDLKVLKERVRTLENENKTLVEKLKHDYPEIIIHTRPQSERTNGFVSIDFTSDNGLEFECFGLSEISPFPEFQIENNRIQWSSPPRHLSAAEKPMETSVIERKMLKHYSVGSSRLSLANRFSLEWGDENDRKITRSPSVDGLFPRQHNIEIALSSMRLSTLEPLLETEVKKNFLEFCIIGAKRSILCGKQYPVFGPRQKAEILDNFPHQHHPFIDSMADFAFPVGVGLYMTDSKVYAEHLRSQKCDQYNVFQFSDSYGTLTYACCLIVNETIPLNPAKSAKTIKALKYLEHLERCGRIILRFMKRAHIRSKNYERKVVMNNKGEVVGYMMVKKVARSGSVVETVKPSPLKQRFLNPLGKSASSIVESSSHSSSKSSNESPSHKINDLLGSKISKFKEDVKSRMKKGHDVPQNGGAELPAGVLNHKSRTAKSQTKKLSNAKQEWQYVVTQRAYCMLSAQPQHALLFQILEEIALRERELIGAIGSTEPGMTSYVSENAKKRMGRTLPPVSEEEEKRRTNSETVSKPIVAPTASSRSVDLGAAWESFTEENRLIRNGFLEYVQSHHLGSRPRGKSKFKKKKETSQKPSFITFSYPRYILRDIVVPAPSDMVTIEMWSVAAIVSVLNPATIISLLNILILEKSLIVQGQNVSMVTAITTAIAGLLSPFNWQGVFIPLVPANAMEILQAPVPFIVGTCMSYRKEDVSPTAAILDLDKVLSFSQELWTEKSLVTLPEVSVMMPIDHVLRGALSNASKLLTSRLPEDKTNLQLATFLVDMTEDEKQAIKEVKQVIQHHNTLFCGDLIVGDGWKKYGAYDASTGEFEFFPQWFLDHQRSILEFQDVVVHTQLFVSYVDQLRVEYLQKDTQREFIAVWIYFRRHLRLKKRLLEPPPPVPMRRISK